MCNAHPPQIAFPQIILGINQFDDFHATTERSGNKYTQHESNAVSNDNVLLFSWTASLNVNTQ